MKAAVLVNPSAGGAGCIQSVCAEIDAFLSGCEIVSAEGFCGCGIRARALRCAQAGGYIRRLNQIVDTLSAENPDFYLVAGGDGLAAYVAGRLLQTGIARPKLLGVAMGTANVGPIISFSARGLRDVSPETVTYAAHGAIEAFDGDVSVAFGFNDVVFGNTILGTVDGAAQPISALAMALDGSKMPQAPLKDIGEHLTIVKNGVSAPSPLEHTAQIVASAVERENLYGRAVSGMLCFTFQDPMRAALLLSERPLVVTDYDPRGITAPALFAQLLFGADDEVYIEGLSPQALIIADGNPYRRSFASVSLRYRPDVIETAG